MFFLVISKIFLLFVNKLIADVKYSLFHREFLQQRIQTQLRQKQSFFLSFCWICEIYFKFWTFWKKKMSLIAYVLPKLETAREMVNWEKCLKSPISEHPWTANMLKGPRHCWNMCDRIFIISLHTSVTKWVQKCLS